MGPEVLSRLVRRSIAITLILAAGLWMGWDLPHALGFAFGGLWSAINWWVWKGLIGEIWLERRFWVVTGLIHLKLPVLYGVGAVVLWCAPLSVGAGLCGFQIPFILLVVESIHECKKSSASMGVSKVSATKTENRNS